MQEMKNDEWKNIFEWDDNIFDEFYEEKEIEENTSLNDVK